MKPFDVVALLQDLPEKGLLRGQDGTVVELLSPDVFEVEFCDNQGKFSVARGPVAGIAP